MSKIYVFLADGLEEIEGLTVVDILRRAGQEVCTVSITGSKTITGSHNIVFQADCLFEDTDFSDGSLYVLPGGLKGTNSLAACKPLTELLVSWNEAGKRLAAICAAPSVLGDLGILRGKKAICYPGFEERLIGAEICREKTVTDGNITTGMGMGTAIPFALELVRVICGEEEAARQKKSICYGHLF